MHANSLRGDPAVAQPGGSGQRSYSDRPAVIVGVQPADSGRPPSNEPPPRNEQGKAGVATPGLPSSVESGLLVRLRLRSFRSRGGRRGRISGSRSRGGSSLFSRLRFGGRTLGRGGSRFFGRLRFGGRALSGSRTFGRSRVSRSRLRTRSRRCHVRRSHTLIHRPAISATHDKEPNGQHHQQQTQTLHRITLSKKKEFPEARSTQPREKRCFTPYRSQTEPFYSRWPQES
jgi:hypothetical protein